MHITKTLILKTIMNRFLVAVVLFGFFLTALPAQAATYNKEVAGWIPWWQDTDGLISATKNIKKLNTIYPFAYEVTATGTIIDKTNLTDLQWVNFFQLAKQNHVEIIPTIAWYNGNQIGSVISDKTKRDAHIKDIVNLVNLNKFDGINIDYEQKNSENINDFSQFLKDLHTKLGRKILTCAVEARTPAEDLYKIMPSSLNYANDYKEIAKSCDRIELMTYDQQRADLTLDSSRTGLPYAPTADKEWVEKVIKLALKDIPKEKILIGIPTYGRAWDVTVAPNSFQDYTRVATLNAPRVLELSALYKAPIGHSVGGEAIMSYFPSDSPYRVLTSLPTPKNTPLGYENAAKALLFANLAKTTVTVRFITYGDALSAKDKLDLATKYKIRGITLFKIDGEEDPNIWNLI